MPCPERVERLRADQLTRVGRCKGSCLSSATCARRPSDPPEGAIPVTDGLTTRYGGVLKRTADGGIIHHAGLGLAAPVEAS